MKIRHFVLAFGLFLWGCGGDSTSFAGSGNGNPPAPAPTGNLVSIQAKETLSAAQLRASRLQSLEVLGGVLDRNDGIGNDAAEGATLDSIWDYILNTLTRYIVYGVQSHKVTYLSHDFSGKTQTVTGLLVVPVSFNSNKISAPILSVQHPTQTLRQYSPSAQNLSDNELQYQSALLFASAGYIVVAADYPGLGDNHDFHPYSHPSLANSVLDLIDVTKTTLPGGVEWNGQLYMMGYSEGGYATLVSARALQQRGTLPDAVATLDGPLSLSDTMRNVILTSGVDFPAPYFIPLIVAGYSPIYSTSVPLLAISQAFVPDPPGYTPPAGSSFAAELIKLTDGDHSSEEINDLVRQAVPYTGPASVLSTAFRAALGDTSSQLVQTLVINDAYYNWLPTFRLRMFHNQFDDLVPPQNTQNAALAFAGQSNVDTNYYPLYIPGLGSVHAGAMPVATVLGFQWIDTFAYPNR
ncbi:MAG: hypothetical protein KF760_05325 [Candidatus Eremiobacteraeota bacterium]|nr:hypothetical protein [Candidatus Eremiobacteraeota bacterium]MCW5867169.1 hypothetical protein [Candidatus Eremiobacteraeota bacterium]